MYGLALCENVGHLFPCGLRGIKPLQGRGRGVCGEGDGEGRVVGERDTEKRAFDGLRLINSEGERVVAGVKDRGDVESAGVEVKFTRVRVRKVNGRGTQDFFRVKIQKEG